MKTTFVPRGTVALPGLIAMLAWAVAASAAESTPPKPPDKAPPELVPALVQSIAAKDLPAPEPIADWNTKWKSYLAGVTSFACFDKWVYVMSCQNGYYLRFERDPATAKLQFREAVEMHRHTEQSWGGLDVRRLADGTAILYANYGTEQRPGEGSLRWFRIDGKTGALTEAGKMEKSWPFPPTPGPYGYAAMVWNLDRTRLYKAFVDNIVWITFKDDGTPEAGGSIKMKNRSDGGGRPHPSAIFSPDGKQFYLLVQRAKPVDGITWLLDQYDVDAKTQDMTYVSSLDIPNTEGGWVQFLDFAPDGRYTYVIVGEANSQRVLTLRREEGKGTLSIAGQKDDALFKGLGGAPWERGKFRFNADGKSGYFTTRGWANSAQLCAFTCDPASGALTLFPVLKGWGCTYDLDTANGSLLWGSNPINVYKTPAARK